MKNLILIGFFSILSTLIIAQSSGDSIAIRVYLEGALMNNGNSTGPGSRPLMRDNLRHSPFTFQNYIPTVSPYVTMDTYINLPQRFNAIGPQNNEIINPEIVLNVSNHNAIVDWVFVEIRHKMDNKLVLGSRSGLLQRDGDIVDMDGESKMYFPTVQEDSAYIVVKHRNHLGVMSTVRDLSVMCDFTNPSTPTWDFGQTNLYNYTGLAQKNNAKPGYKAMWAGDFDASGKIKNAHPSDDVNVLFFGVMTHPNNPTNAINFDQGYGYNGMDFDLNSKVKFDNPNDDRNMHIVQLYTYPLNVNLRENFDQFFEQVPPLDIE